MKRLRQQINVFSASPKVFSPSPPSMSSGTLPQPFSTLSTETLAYPPGTGRLWILGVLVRSIGLTTAIATFFYCIPIWYMQLTDSKSLCDIIHGEV